MVQRYPYYPFAYPYQFASGPSQVGALALAWTFDPQHGYQPHTITYANGQVRELFLSSHPPMGPHQIVYDSARNKFLRFGSGGDIWELDLGPSAAYSTYGAGCLGSRGTPALSPQSGSAPRVGTNFVVQAANLPLVGPAFLFFGFSNTTYGTTPLPYNLGPIGAPACSLLASGDSLYPIANILGIGTFTLPVPNLPGLTFYNQAFCLDPPANSLGITASNAGRGTIGN